MSSNCMWHMCGCCWLKVVVVIAGLKMPGGGCVLLIPYLISRSRGEALNPKHTHTLSHSLANARAHMHANTHNPPTNAHSHVLRRLLIFMRTKFWNSQKNCVVKCFKQCIAHNTYKYGNTCITHKHVTQVWPYPADALLSVCFSWWAEHLRAALWPCLRRIALVGDAYCRHLHTHKHAQHHFI